MPEQDHPPVDGWAPPSPSGRKALLDRARTVAVVGASSNPARASNFVMTYLLSSSTDYVVYPVNPRETEVLGLPAYPSLFDLPTPPDIVDVFRRSDDLPDVAAEAVEAGAGTFWAQRFWSPKAAQVATEGGLAVVMDRCLKVEHARFHGGLHLAGFDTGVITSRRRT